MKTWIKKDSETRTTGYATDPKYVNTTWSHTVHKFISAAQQHGQKFITMCPFTYFILNGTTW